MDAKDVEIHSQEPQRGTAAEVFSAFLTLGVTSFGGPVAHLGYFHEAFVVRRKWIGEAAYADLVALCQFLPGPASSQVGMALGLRRAGYAGMLAAWVAFTLPSAILLVAFAWGAAAIAPEAGGWIEGLKAAAVAVVAQAVIAMAASLTPDRERATVAVVAMIVAMLVPTAAGQVLAIAAGGIAGLVWLRPSLPQMTRHDSLAVTTGKTAGVAFLAVFALLLVALPLLVSWTADPVLAMIDSFYRTGSLVFGGGHVVLPLLEAEVVQTGRVGEQAFLAGYGAAQAVPGPLFAFAAYLGAVYTSAPSGLLGAAIALVAIYLPSMLLIVGVLPFWEGLRMAPLARRALLGVNAAVVGLLAAALYDPVFTVGIVSGNAMAIAAASFVALTAWKAPPWAVVVAAGVAGFLIL
ncbi:chromate efflux transporter [Mesorhizobium sp. YM1C-6-2]|uniref:chromate efflux transporter n=1 Tax=Mesorhizobium sp. YM1C-6-2 TaxID=1827501 RepID=UPI001FDFC866|nr:chromate efflux transporter [Mesorhizobium sp. YM1C-6-2]